MPSMYCTTLGEAHTHRHTYTAADNHTTLHVRIIFYWQIFSECQWKNVETEVEVAVSGGGSKRRWRR
jgi:hypothetical protein